MEHQVSVFAFRLKLNDKIVSEIMLSQAGEDIKDSNKHLEKVSKVKVGTVFVDFFSPLVKETVVPVSLRVTKEVML